MKRSRAEDGEEQEDEEPQVVASTSSSAGSSGLAASASNNAASSKTGNRAALAELPSSEMYEKSFMHRDHVTHIVCTVSDFVITGSRDGQLKFWKKMQNGIEFVKHFRAHLAPLSGLTATLDGSLLATTAADKAFKVFDVLSFDMIAWASLDFTPGTCEWIGGGGGRSRSKPLVAIADEAANESKPPNWRGLRHARDATHRCLITDRLGRPYSQETAGAAGCK